MSNSPISKEQLQAFVDGQLDETEKNRVLKAIQADRKLGRDVCELRTLTELVRHAYANPPASTPTSKIHATRPENKPFWKYATAAILLLGIGGAVGWTTHPDAVGNNNSIHAMYWDNERAFHNSQLDTISPQENKHIIVHLNTSSPEKFESALSTAEQLLKKYSHTGTDTEIEVVANASAIKMLRAGYSPYAERIHQLQAEYFNLTFLACKDAIDHVKELEGPGARVELLPDIDVTPSALEHILERLKEGWVYINV